MLWTKQTMGKWENEKSFAQYIKDNKITQISLETYNDYYIEVEDDSYVGINTVILDAKEQKD